MTDAIFVGLNIALVPGKAKWRLDHKEIKVSVGRGSPQTLTSDRLLMNQGGLSRAVDRRSLEVGV